MQVRPLSQEDPLEKEVATHASILPGKLHGQGRLASYSPWGCKKSDVTEQLSTVMGDGGLDSFIASHIYVLFQVIFPCGL